LTVASLVVHITDVYYFYLDTVQRNWIVFLSFSSRWSYLSKCLQVLL